MPFRSEAKIRKCKYCENPAKINYYGIKRLHKGYYRTCGNEICLKEQYKNKIVNQSKAYVNKGIQAKCAHCGNVFIKTNNTSKWCIICVPDKKSRSIMARYSLSKKEYLDLINSVNGICQICLKNRGTVVDHCHKTKKIRGFICQHCNTSLNLVENIQALKRAIFYLGLTMEDYI